MVLFSLAVAGRKAKGKKKKKPGSTFFSFFFFLGLVQNRLSDP
jgi:hypothetical protein